VKTLTQYQTALFTLQRSMRNFSAFTSEEMELRKF